MTISRAVLLSKPPHHGSLGGSGGGTPSRPLPVFHTGSSTYFVVDTTGLWQPAGRVPAGTLLTANGNDVRAKYGFTQPTPDAPVQVYPWARPERLDLALGSYYEALGFASLWRGYPWKWPSDTYAAAPVFTVATTAGSTVVAGAGFPGYAGTLAQSLTAGVAVTSLSIVVSAKISDGDSLVAINASGQKDTFAVKTSPAGGSFAAGPAAQAIPVLSATPTNAHAPGDAVNESSNQSMYGIFVRFLNVNGSAQIPGYFQIAYLSDSSHAVLTSTIPTGGTLAAATMWLSINYVFFSGAYPSTQTAPTPANHYGDAAAYQNIQTMRNLYGFVEDDAGAPPLDQTRSHAAIFAVAPGDQPFVTFQSHLGDTRAEVNLTDNFSPPGGPSGGMDVMGNVDRKLRAWRHDFEFPASWQAPVVVQNRLPLGGAAPWIKAAWPPTTTFTVSSAGATSGVNLGVVTGTGFSANMVGQFFSIGPLPGTWQVVSFQSTTKITFGSFDAAGSPIPATVPAVTAVAMAYVATRTIQNIRPSVGKLSNALETEGPAVFVWASGVTNAGQINFRYTPTSYGVALRTLTVDTFLPGWDPGDHSQRICTIVELQPGLFASGGGVPWVVGAAPAYDNPYLVPNVTPAETLSQMIILEGNGTLLNPGLATYPFAPYGVPLDSHGQPLQPFGGGYFRCWRRIGMAGNFVCVTPGQGMTGRPAVAGGIPWAVPGLPTMDAAGNVSGDSNYPEFGTDCGKVYGPTLKVVAGKLETALASAPGGTGVWTGNVIVDHVVSPANTTFASQGGDALIGPIGGPYEVVTFSSYSGTTMKVTARGAQGTTPLAHAGGGVEWVAGLVEGNVASPGLNAAQDVPTPVVAREWPLMIGPDTQSVAVQPTPL